MLTAHRLRVQLTPVVHQDERVSPKLEAQLALWSAEQLQRLVLSDSEPSRARSPKPGSDSRKLKHKLAINIKWVLH